MSLPLKLIATFIFSLFLFAPAVSAQTTFDQLQKDYLQSVAVYNQTRDTFIEARSEYLKFQTLVSKTAAVDATQKFMTARQRVMINYLKMIRERTQQSPGITEAELKPYLVYVEDEIESLEKQLPLFDTADDLDDLVKENTSTKKNHTNVINNGFKMKSLIAVSKIRELRKTATELINLTGEQVSRIKGESQVDVTNPERWLLEANERLVFAKTNEDTALADFSKLKANDARRGMDNQYAKFTITLGQANQYLKEAKDFLKEIIHDIRFD